MLVHEGAGNKDKAEQILDMQDDEKESRIGIEALETKQQGYRPIRTEFEEFVSETRRQEKQRLAAAR